MAKIFIMGAPGSGKSYMAKRLSTKLAIPWYDLDSDAAYELSPTECEDYYEHLRASDSWICEVVVLGLQRQWVEGADLVIILGTPRTYRALRILLRAFLKGIGVRFQGQEGKETWGSLRYRLSETWHYLERHQVPFLSQCEMYHERIFVFSKNVEALKWICSQVRNPEAF